MKKIIMKTIDITMVRVYITEESKLLEKILSYLKDDAKINGVSVFRAISGFGETGEHSIKLVDLCLNLPLVIEFFDEKNKTTQVIEKLNSMVKPEHIVFWDAKTTSNS